MRLIDGYLFRQMLFPAFLATAALTAVTLLSQSLTFLDVLVDQGQTVFVFLKVVLLTMPQMLALVLPIALFVAALVTLNRLHMEQEIVVCFAGGMSRWRVTAPAFRLAALAALLTLFLQLWAQPVCARLMREELFKIRTDLAASLVQEGQFNQQAGGLTVYAQGADAQGQLRNVFIYQSRNGAATTYAAKTGRLTKRNGQPVLIMRKGSNQAYDAKGVLNHLSWDEYVFELAPFVSQEEVLHYKIPDRFLHELMFPDLTQPWEQQNRKKMLAEAHYRLSSALYNLTLMALALTAVLGGSFSRTGYGRRIATAAGIAAVVRLLGFAAQSAASSAPALNVLQYLVPLVPLGFAAAQLYRSSLPNPPRGPAVAIPAYVSTAQ